MSPTTVNAPAGLPPPPRLSAFAERLGHKAAAVASTREGYATALHAHDCDMLFVPVAGRFDILDTRGEPLQSAPGHFVWFAAGAAHATAAQTLRQTHIAVYVDPDFWGMALRAQGVVQPLQGMRAGSAALNALSQCLLELVGAPDDQQAVYCGALIMEAARLSANPLAPEVRPPGRQVAELLAEQLQADLSRGLSVAAFADRQRLSRRQVERLFRAEFGMSPLAYQQIKRLERARFLLEHTEDSVLSVAQQVGWASGSYLSRVLVRNWAATAAEIRASGRPPLASIPMDHE